MQIKNYLGLIGRAFMLAIFLATMSIACEWIVVLVLRMKHPVPFSSFIALALFCSLSGFIPFQSSPSRLSAAPINLLGRLILLLEVTVLIVGGAFASSEFMAMNHIVVPIDIEFAPYAYVLVLALSLMSNFGKLKEEVRRSGNSWRA